MSDEHIQSLCDAFEEEWIAAQETERRPKVEDYLTRVGEEHRQELLTELLPVEHPAAP